jgi:hypothetical protein
MHIGIGDAVFITGLFSHHPGKARNLRVIRVGNIAAMPDEPVKTQRGEMEAYLIEARSLGGLSGSPVFVRPVGPEYLVGDFVGRPMGFGDARSHSGLAFAERNGKRGHGRRCANPKDRRGTG